MTTLEDGARFEARVAQLLRSSTGYKNVREQQHIRGKNVDIIFQKQWNPHRFLTVAVECKNWKTGITRETVREMYFDHKPLFDHHDIDELWIITPNPVAPTVQEHADAFDGIEILHISELEKDIIDFSIYATSLECRFTKDNLAKYYIPSRLQDSPQTLHSKITDWLTSNSERPIAVWAGYGMGKTSYAAFLASQLARLHLDDATCRIPILIPLGDYYTSPRLDGLLANTLTRDNGVHGYNFNTFWNLHQAGRFVIILDGFDEMKHAMTRGEFTAIAKEIRRLILPNSKIILLGRPDAIVTGEEHATLIRGTRSLNGIEIEDDISAEFDEVRIDFFSKDEYLTFLSRYIECFCRSEDKASYATKRINDIEGLGVDDLIRRPVQARMLAQILLNPKNSVARLSRYALYDMFIGDCLSREEEKSERRKLPSETRRRFMQDLSWWLWAYKRTRTFTVSDIPKDVVKYYVDPDRDTIGQLRELLIGSLVEERSIGTILTEKAAGTFYFPHLSFTEFLAAEYLIERDLSDAEILMLSQSLDGEVMSFIQGYKKNDGRLKLYSDLVGYRGGLPWKFLLFLADSTPIQNKSQQIDERRISNIWHFAVDLLAALNLSWPTSRKLHDSYLSQCANIIGADDYRSTLIATQLMLMVAVQRDDIRQQVCNLFLGTVFRGINIDKLENMTKGARYRIISDTDDLLVRLLSLVQVANRDFQFDLSELLATTNDLDSAIFGIPESNRILVKVTAGTVRSSLRTNQAKSRFDHWLSWLGTGTVFWGERKSWDDATTGRRIGGYSEKHA